MKPRVALILITWLFASMTDVILRMMDLFRCDQVRIYSQQNTHLEM
jgi:hypothetical protein